MWAMVTKEFRELSRDRRTMALLLVVPIVLLVVFGYAANFSVDTTRVIIAGPQAAQAQSALENIPAGRDHFEIARVENRLSESEIRDLFRREEIKAVIQTEENNASQSDSENIGSDETNPPLATFTHLWVDGSHLFTAQSAAAQWLQVLVADMKTRMSQVRTQITAAQEEMQQMQALAAQAAAPGVNLPTNPGANPPAVTQPANPAAKIKSLSGQLSALSLDDLSRERAVTVAFNPDLRTSWVMIPGLIGLIMTFIGTIVTSIGLVREREAGTLEQLAAMPLRPSAIIAGKILPYFVLSLADAVVVTLVAVWLFGVPFVGVTWRFALLVTLFLFVVLGIGVLLSVISQNTGQAIQLAIMLVMPQVLLSGLVFPLESMAWGVRWIGYILPLTWFNLASGGIMLKGSDFAELALPMGVLALQAAVIFTLATVRMRRMLARGGALR